MKPDGSGARLVTSAAGQFSWSPDGTRLAVARAGTLVVVAADGSGERTLPGAGRDVFMPIWSPDGTRIAFSRSGLGLFTIAAEGSGQATLVDTEGVYASWSPDSRLSAVRANGQLVVYERDGTTRVVASDAGVVPPAWSPDRSRVAYLGRGVTVVGADGSGARTLTGLCCGSGHVGSPLAWSPDGRRIAFTDQGHVRTVATDGGAVAVTAPRADSPSWSPDGRQLAVLDQSASLSDGLLNQEVALMDANGGSRRIVLDLPSSLAAFRVLWSPTGDRLAVLVGPRGTGPSF